jgi:hypothetical protein
VDASLRALKDGDGISFEELELGRSTCLADGLVNCSDSQDPSVI